MRTIKEIVIEFFTDKYIPWYAIGILTVMLGAYISSNWVVILGFCIQGWVAGGAFRERTEL